MKRKRKREDEETNKTGLNKILWTEIAEFAGPLINGKQRVNIFRWWVNRSWSRFHPLEDEEDFQIGCIVGYRVNKTWVPYDFEEWDFVYKIEDVWSWKVDLDIFHIEGPLPELSFLDREFINGFIEAREEGHFITDDSLESLIRINPKLTDEMVNLLINF